MPLIGRPGRWTRAALLVLFTLSGASGLVYEVLWARRLTHIFGSTTLAVSTVLAAFMGGLAAGSFLIGAWADRNRSKALRAYGLLEIAIGLFGLAVPALLKAIELVYLGLAPALESAPTLFFVAQFLLLGLVLLIPCALMGGTLPVLARWLVGREDEIGGRVGALYAANTFGAGAGTAAATYLLLPFAGVREGELIAVAINLAVGLIALALSRNARDSASRPDISAQEAPSATPPTPTPLLLAIGLSGFAAMADEVAWARLVALVFGSSVYAFGLMLLLFLFGIALGSALFARIRRTDPIRVLGLALIGNTLASLLGIALVPHLPTLYMRGFPAIKDSFALQQALQLFEIAPVLLPLAILFGIAFPAAIAATSSLSAMGRAVGRVTAWNTIGTVTGAFLGGFVLIPWLGLRGTLTVAAAAAAAGGMLALRRAAGRGWSRAGLAAAAAALTGALFLPAWPRDLLAEGTGFYAAIYGNNEAFLKAARGMEILFYKDGIATTLSVDRQGPYRFYRSNGKTDASTDPGDMANQLLLGHLPMLAHPAPRDVFVLGLGTGVSAAAVARYPVQSVDIADIESAARDATQFFSAENRNILSDPRVRFLVADGRNALLARRKTYDVIISDPSDVWVAGVGNLFTREFYLLARSRLKPGGLMVQWFHMHSLPPADMKLIVATFRSVFPQTSFWRPNRGDVILVGTVEPTPWDYARLRERVEKVPGVSQDLVGIGFWHPLSIFAAFVLDGEDLDRMLAGVGGLHTDNRPVIEYMTPRSGYSDTTSVNDAGVQALQTKWLPAIAGFDEKRDLDARALYLLGFGHASIGRTDSAIRLMELAVHAENPEAKFFVGLGNQYRATGSTAKAAEAYATALGRDSGETEASLHLAEIERARGNDPGAEKILRAALLHARDDAALALAAARLWMETGRAAEVPALVAPALAKEPQNAGLQLVAGRALAATHRADEADAALRLAAAAAGQDAAALREAADALAALGDVDAAAAAYQRASELEPDSAAAFVGLARAALRRGDAATARAARARALELDPYNADALGMPGK